MTARWGCQTPAVTELPQRDGGICGIAEQMTEKVFHVVMFKPLGHGCAVSSSPRWGETSRATFQWSPYVTYFSVMKIGR